MRRIVFLLAMAGLLTGCSDHPAHLVGAWQKIGDIFTGPEKDFDIEQWDGIQGYHLSLKDSGRFEGEPVPKSSGYPIVGDWKVLDSRRMQFKFNGGGFTYECAYQADEIPLGPRLLITHCRRGGVSVDDYHFQGFYLLKRS